MHTKECEESGVTKTEKLSKFTSCPQNHKENVTSNANFIKKTRKKIFVLKKGRKVHTKKQEIWQPYQWTGTGVYTNSTEAPKLKYTQ